MLRTDHTSYGLKQKIKITMSQTAELKLVLTPIGMLPLLLDKYFLKNYTSLPAVYKAGFLVFLTHPSESGPVGRRSVNHMNKEKLTTLSDAKSQYVKSWADISSRLPDN